jgi:uncharacterized membrane protein
MSCALLTHPRLSSFLSPSTSGRVRPSSLGNRRLFQLHAILENSAGVTVNTPIEAAWDLWEEKERIPNWMPWISDIRVLEEDPSLSEWTLSTFQFNRQWEIKWVAKNLTPIKYQKVQWQRRDFYSSCRFLLFLSL